MTQVVNADPRHGKAGRQPTKSALKRPSANADPGLFGKMFDLPAFAPSDAALKALADAMLDASPGDSTGDNPNIPSGFTYLGQFVTTTSRSTLPRFPRNRRIHTRQPT